jgi:hypothetical protein
MKDKKDRVTLTFLYIAALTVAITMYLIMVVLK